MIQQSQYAILRQELALSCNDVSFRPTLIKLFSLLRVVVRRAMVVPFAGFGSPYLNMQLDCSAVIVVIDCVSLLAWSMIDI